jgi:DNA invertase Pin-like site-specific DNA recombinase
MPFPPERSARRRRFWGWPHPPKRQRAAIEAFAKHAVFEIVAEFYDQAVSGTDPIDARPGFAAMAEHIAGNGARTIIVATGAQVPGQ